MLTFAARQVYKVFGLWDKGPYLKDGQIRVRVIYFRILRSVVVLRARRVLELVTSLKIIEVLISSASSLTKNITNTTIPCSFPPIQTTLHSPCLEQYVSNHI